MVGPVFTYDAKPSPDYLRGLLLARQERAAAANGDFTMEKSTQDQL